MTTESFLDYEYFKLLSEQFPTLPPLIRQLLDAGQTPEQIAKQTEKGCPKNAVLPGLIFGAAKYMLSN